MLGIKSGGSAPQPAPGAERREENAMEPHVTRRAMTGLTIGGLFALGGLKGLAQQASGAAVAPLSPPAPRGAYATSISSAAVDFQMQMRKLWEDHITWTRLYIVSAAADLPDRELTAQRLLRNQADIGDAAKPFYGDVAGDELTTLLQEHITGAAALLDAAKSGDQAAVETASADWYANAEAIAAFLAAANPDHWPQDDLRAEMRMHLDHTLDEATARLTGDFAADIAAYDAVHDHILAFADRLIDGIVAQFPERFA
jgi:hypothetical protein